MHDFGTGRLIRYSLDSFERACDRAEAEAAKRSGRSRRERTPPTPAVTVEVIWLSVRERGLAALNEPANKRRLASCDTAARAELKHRIEHLRGG
jgi:hypothetical protein